MHSFFPFNFAHIIKGRLYILWTLKNCGLETFVHSAMKSVDFKRVRMYLAFYIWISGQVNIYVLLKGWLLTFPLTATIIQSRLIKISMICEIIDGCCFSASCHPAGHCSWWGLMWMWWEWQNPPIERQTQQQPVINPTTKPLMIYLFGNYKALG